MPAPNLLLILSDQHNPHIMGCAGDPWVRTPNLDALAARSTRFSQTYCASPLCVPSRMALMSGRYPMDTGVWTNNALMNPNIPTFAHGLALAGYHTVLCGRMHFTDTDQHHGFIDRLVGDMCGAMVGEKLTFGGKIPTYCCGQNHPSVRDSGFGQTSYMAYDQEVFARAAQWIQERDRQQSEQPFCLLVGGVLPHNPYVCPRDLFDQYMDLLPPPERYDDNLKTLHPAMLKWRQVRGIDQLKPEQSRRARAAYYGLVTYLDRLIGALLAILAASRLSENTVVAYLSDHGEMAGEHGIWWKDSFYEGSVGVPMLWSRPGVVSQGITCNTPASLLDVGPTCLELAGADPLPFYRGQSLASHLRGNSKEPSAERAIFSEIYPIGMFPARMVRRGRWKLNHFHAYEHPQLFDLENDPDERNDLGRDPAHKPIRNELRALILDGWSGDWVQSQAALQKEEYRLILDYNRRFPPGRTELWREPVDSNALE